jgi:hypothetical protein
VLDTARSRGIVIAVVIGVVSVVGLVVAIGGDAAYDDERDDFVTAAEAQLAGTTGAEAYELWLDLTMAESTELDDLLSIDGHDPSTVTSPRPDEVEATYRIEAWGREGEIVVRLTADGPVVDEG